MKATILKILFIIAFLSGVASAGIARTMNKDDIPLEGGDHDEEPRSVTLPIPIIASINDDQLFIDFLAPLGEVLITVSRESGSVHSINYSIVSAQTVLLTLDDVVVGEEYQIEFVTLDGKRYWGNFVIK